MLLLEDSPLDADLIFDWLNSGGMNCRVDCVQTRATFVEALGDESLDIVLSDYSLPDFDGMTALQLAQELRPDIPFIFVSGYLGEDRAIETLKRGATDYVLKGRLERLQSSVERAMREAKERAKRRRAETTLRILSEASLVLSSLDYSTTLAHVARLAVPHFADYCVVDVLAEDGSLERVAVAHANPQYEALAQQLLEYVPAPDKTHPTREALQSGQARLVPEISASDLEAYARDENHLKILSELGIQSCMFVPLVSEGQTLGVMAFVSSSPDRTYEDFDLTAAEDLARRCAMAVENARLHRKTLDALRTRDEFLAVLSHELRSPLTSIVGWVQLLKEGDLDAATQMHGLEVIERNTQAQVQLIQDLLEVSRIITGRLHLELKPVDVTLVARTVIDLMQPTAQAKSVTVNFVDAVAGSEILGDAPRLQQVLWNLASNALKFTPRNGQINISLHIENNFLKIEVQDSGEGIAPEFLPFVFDRFRQANSTSTRQHGGLGLGLAIVRHLTEMHGGTVQACSEGIGQGATFSVNLPLLTSPIEAPEENAKNHSRQFARGKIVRTEQPSLKGLRILLVEDGDDARELLSQVLLRAGAQVDAANSVGAAMQALQAHVPDVLISDIAMPGEDGYGLIRRLKEWELEHQHHIPAIALTAYAGEQDRLRAISAGFQAHFSKPVEPALLISSVVNIASHLTR